MRRNAREVTIGNMKIGGDTPIAVQSMTNTDTADAPKTIEQIKKLETAGCDIVRVSVYNAAAAQAVRAIRDGISVPLVADVHFDHRLAITAIENGVDKLRINPGNIKNPRYIEQLADCAKAHHIPIRIGVNAGSLSKAIFEKYGQVTPEALVASALENVALLEQYRFYDIVISVKVSDVRKMVESYQLIANECSYPLHLGVTEAGTVELGTVKNAVGIGALLLQGIGDTIRVSLTGDPVPEVKAAQNILRSVGLFHKGIEIISCPTCARTKIPLEKIIAEVEAKTAHITQPLKVAIMGCVVNGPGEAREADIGLAGGGNGEKAAIFKNGQLVCTVEEENMVSRLIEEINKLIPQQ